MASYVDSSGGYHVTTNQIDVSIDSVSGKGRESYNGWSVLADNVTEMQNAVNSASDPSQKAAYQYILDNFSSVSSALTQIHTHADSVQSQIDTVSQASDPAGNTLGLPGSTPTTAVTTSEATNLATGTAPNFALADGTPVSDQFNILSGQSLTPNSDDATGNVATLPTVTVTASKLDQTPTYSPLENPLDKYATYTYGISLHLLSSTDYSSMVEDNTNWKPTQTLIASAGRYDNSMPRSPAFTDDFYFDNLRMQTIIGLNGRTQGTNVIDVSFTIIEPLGLTLLNRLIAATNSINEKNYLQMPYMLQIDFFGNDDIGSIVHPIPDLTKYIPIKLIDMKMKVGTKGSEYQFRAVPFNHLAFMESNVSTPAHFEVFAGTVKAFFENTETTVAQQKQEKDAAQRELNNPTNFGTGTDASISRNAAAQQAQKTVSSAYRINSYTGAFNDWNKALATATNKAAKFPPIQIQFVIDQAIADSAITVPKTNSPTRAPMVDTKNPNEVAAQLKSNQGVGTVGPDLKRESFSINTGTSIVSIINMIIRNSDYIRNQLTDPNVDVSDPQALANKQQKDLNWFKIIPVVKMKDFDPLQNKWALEIVYYVKQYTYYNQKHPYAPLGKPNGYVKDYQYMYTGQNVAVIDFNIDFDALFFTALSTDRSKTDAVSQAQDANPDTNKDLLSSQPAGSAQPKQYVTISGDQQSTASGDAIRDSKTQVAADVMKSIYSNARGDMINVQLKIIGDPHFIKQDDFYLNPGQAKYSEANQLINPGTLAMDAGEIHARLLFKTPTDYDDATGLLKTTGGFTQSVFSGIYKIVNVDSEFRSGAFTQTLNLIRLFDQPDYDVESSPNASTNTNTERFPALTTPAQVTTFNSEFVGPPDPQSTNVVVNQQTENTTVTDPSLPPTPLDSSTVVDTAPQTNAEQALIIVGANAPTVDIGTFNTFNLGT